MKRFYLSTVGVAFVALLFATTGSAQPAKHGEPANATRPQAAKLPTLPANIKSRDRWNIGVKCDVPPFGYIDVRGKNAGFDVEIARQFARYAFGKRHQRELRSARPPRRVSRCSRTIAPIS